MRLYKYLTMQHLRSILCTVEKRRPFCYNRAVFLQGIPRAVSAPSLWCARLSQLVWDKSDTVEAIFFKPLTGSFEMHNRVSGTTPCRSETETDFRTGQVFRKHSSFRT